LYGKPCRNLLQKYSRLNFQYFFTFNIFFVETEFLHPLCICHASVPVLQIRRFLCTLTPLCPVDPAGGNPEVLLPVGSELPTCDLTDYPLKEKKTDYPAVEG